MMRSWVNILSSRLSVPTRRAAGAWSRPRVEVLEDRLVPAAVSWVGGASGSWALAGNWSTGTLPGAGDDVAINGPVTVTHAAGSDTIHSLSLGLGAMLQVTGNSSILAAQAVNASGSSLTLQNGANFVSANPFTNAGSVVIGSGSTLMAPYTQTGGTTSLQGGNLANFGPPPGNSLAFNGTSDFVEVPSSASLDSQALTKQMTLEAWVYLNQLPSAAGHIMQIVAKAEPGNDLDLQVETDNRIHFYAGDWFPDNVVSGTVLQAGRWYHVAATYQAGQPGQLQIFVNGVLDATQSGNFSRTTNSNPLTIGWSYVWPGRFFNGLITDVSVWNVVETQAQVQTEMGARLNGNESGLVASWAFTEGTATIAHDATANHNDGSLGNGVPSQEPAWTVSPVASVNLPGGSLEGVGTVTGNVNNSGATLTPGSAGPSGTLTISGSYTQGSAGTLDIPVGGSSSSGEFGMLAVTGPAAFAGTLTVAAVNGYTPMFTDSYTAVTFGSESGDFSTYNLPSLGGDPLLTAAYVPAGSPTGLVLTGSLSPTATVLTSSANSSAYGQPVTLTATVSAASGATPTGTVDFKDETTGQDLGTAALQLTGGLDQATVVVPGFTAGSHTIEALYTNNNAGAFEDSSSSPLVQGVNPATPTVSVSDAGGTYNGNAVTATATVAGVSGTPASSLEGVSPTLTYYAGATALPGAPAGAGTYTLVATFAGSTDYSAASASTTFTITPALLTVTANNASKVYGQVNPTFTDTITGFVNGETANVVSGSASLTTTATTSSPVGAYVVTAAQGTLSAANYTFAFVNGTLQVNQAAPTVSVSDAGGTYDGVAFSATATVAGVSGTPASSLEGVSPTLTYYAGATALPGAPAGAGTYTVVATFAGSADYGAASASTTFTITPALLTVTANNTSKVYGQVNPTFTDTITGFVNGETANVVSGSASLTTTATTSSPVGAYVVTAAQGTLSAANYTFAFVNGTLQVNQAAPTVSVSDAGGTYNGVAFPATATVAGVSGTPASSLEGISLTLTYYAGTTALPGAPAGAGTYTVVATFAGSADYGAASASTTFTITPALLTVTANNASKVYGQANPTFTDTITGFVNGETANVVSGSASLTTTATTSSPVGAYVVTAAQGTLSAANYTFAFVNGTLYVNRAATGTALSAFLVTPLAGMGKFTLTAKTSVMPPGSGGPTGSVDFFDTTTGTDLGTAPLSGGTATLNFQPVVAGQHLLRATYSGDGNFLSSQGTVALQPVPPASLSGFVFEDFNDDGKLDFGEPGIAGVTIHLRGTDDLGHAVDQTMKTSGDGAYHFLNLRPGSYTITETQPAGYTQGIDSVGTAGGILSATDQFFVHLSKGVNGLNYNFGERPAATGPVQHGQTGGIGFWHNKHGQSLILALNGGTGTQLGDWLAATLPNLYGRNARSDNLAGKSNAYVAAFYQHLFAQKGVKLDAQVLATALSVYVTNATLDPTKVAAQYGFTVCGDGVGTATFNVGCCGPAFGVANHTTMTVMDLLLATDAQAVNGVLYNGNKHRCEQAKRVYAALNEAGHIH
jgi:hypothetical protein